MTLVVELSELLPVLPWRLAIDPDVCDTDICVWLRGPLSSAPDPVRVYAAVFTVARKTLDYRLVAAAYIQYVRLLLEGIVVKPSDLVKTAAASRIEVRVATRRSECWEGARYRGILYAEMYLDAQKPVYYFTEEEPPEELKPYARRGWILLIPPEERPRAAKKCRNCTLLCTAPLRPKRRGSRSSR